MDLQNEVVVHSPWKCILVHEEDVGFGVGFFVGLLAGILVGILVGFLVGGGVEFLVGGGVGGVSEQPQTLVPQ
jgi:hypothetical protein